jgi:hypothetical protein
VRYELIDLDKEQQAVEANRERNNAPASKVVELVVP